MKRNVKFFTIVISLLLLSAIILTGCMYAIAADNGEMKLYDIDITSTAQGGSVIDDSPVSQNELQKKFSDMAEISKSGKSITVISEKFLDNYWGNEENISSKALTSEEVLYIVQDSIRIYFEYDEYVMLSNQAIDIMHRKLSDHYSRQFNATYTFLPINKEAMTENYFSVCSDIHQLILYRLAALSTPDAFVYGDEVIAESERPANEYEETFNKCIFYIPKNAKDVSRKVWIDLLSGEKKISGTDEGIRYFNLYPNGYERIELYADKMVGESVFPTAEMESTQANRVVDIIDLTVMQGIPTDEAIELFYETEKFEYYFPSIRSRYVMAIMYDGREIPLTDALENGYIAPEEFDNFDFEYLRMVKHESNQGEIYEYPFKGFYSQAVYTDKLRDDGIFPYANLINSAEEMKIYTNEIKENDIYVTDRGTPEIPSYDEWTTKYTEEWFEENSLIIVVVEADNDLMPNIDMMQVEHNRRIDLYLAEETRGSKNDQVYTIFLEMFKIEAEILNVFD